MPDPIVIDAARLRALIDNVCATVVANTEALTALDQAIGDGDHGLNMKRGFDAVRLQLDALAAKPLPDALRQLGTTLIMKVGGASGPLYGTLFMTLGKELPAAPSVDDLARALGVAIDAIRKLTPDGQQQIFTERRAHHLHRDRHSFGNPTGKAERREPRQISGGDQSVQASCLRLWRRTGIRRIQCLGHLRGQSIERRRNQHIHFGEQFPELVLQ